MISSNLVDSGNHTDAVTHGPIVPPPTKINLWPPLLSASLVFPELPVAAMTLRTLSTCVPARTVIKELLRIHEVRCGENTPVFPHPGS